MAFITTLSNILNAQWQKFDFPNLRPFNTNSKYLYSVHLDSSYFLRTINDWQTWDTVQTGFPISNFAADSIGQVFVSEKLSPNIYKLYLSQNQSQFEFLFSDTMFLSKLYIHKNYFYALTIGQTSYRSINNGIAFFEFNQIVSNYGVSNIDAVCDSILFVYGFYNTYPYNGVRYISYDKGDIWQNVNNNYTNGELIYASPYIFMGQYVITRSIDGGHTFEICSSSLNVKSMAYGNGVLLAGTNNGGVYATTNKGDTWIAFNDGLDTLCCNAYVAVTDSFYYVTLNDSITYRRSIHDLTGISNNFEELPLQLYPNPATDYLTLKSGNPQSFTYQLYNMQGTLQHEGKTTNSQTEINVAYLPRGMYILKVVTEKQTVTKKVVLQ